ncbi:MAG: glycosyl hydrolase family 32 [Candidatus Cryptobacteroides sp.]
MRFNKIIVMIQAVAIVVSACGKEPGGNPWYNPDDPSGGPDVEPEDSRLLYNGILLPDKWPPAGGDPSSDAVMDEPYLGLSHPDVVPIDVGRQLFVDDYLIESTTLARECHTAKKYVGNPVLKPESKLEIPSGHFKGAVPKDGGVWWEPRENKFKMWYEAGWLNTMAYATSADGLSWERPSINKNGTNELLTISDLVPNSCAVVLDYDAPDDQRYKMFFRQPNANAADSRGKAMVSSDGIIWTKRKDTGVCGDRSTMFYNPFRKKWVFSIRSVAALGPTNYGRTRYYRESSDFLEGASWEKSDPVFWCRADKLDEPDPKIGLPAQLYNLNAVAYESVMLGLHQILVDENDIAMNAGRPKVTDLKVSFSRDGFHWTRPCRDAFIPSSRTSGSWDRGYVQSVGGICIVMGDQLWFYYSGFRGNAARPGESASLHDDSATGIAVLRRDGFCSMSGDGELTTVPVTFSGKYLFVNADCADGELRAEILDENGAVIPGFGSSDCTAVSENSTIIRMEWKGKKDLSGVSGKKVKFHFIQKNGKLYSFWVSPSGKGESMGYTAGGGPGFTGNIDNVGLDGYKAASDITPL